ncbi:choice-of-anchor D domain-containing protein [Flavobacteriaceae bacterium 144Ye]|nr:choice-of-anchor D domain-containing protein [Flavobacteriaceae bacterium 144Ye]
MKKKYSLVLIAFLCLTATGFGQITIYSESMYNGTGGASGNSIVVHETNNRFNEDALTYSGTGDMRTTSTSTGYAGSSGTWNIMLNTMGETFVMDGINASSYTGNLILSFGIRKGTTASNGSGFIVEYSTTGSGGAFTALSFPLMPTGGGTTGWYYRSTTTTIPNNVTTFRFRSTNTTEWRLDDILLEEFCSPPTDPLGTISGTTPACNSTTLSYAYGTNEPLAGVDYYWQTTANGTDLSNDASGTYNATTTGTYYVRAYDGVSCWSTNSVSYAVVINTPPTITNHPQNSTVSDGANTTFTIAANNANSYQWEVSTNGGTIWNPLSNGGVYSGVTTTTLNITGAILSMDGYLYRCRAIATPCSDAISNPGLLTVNNTPPNNGLNLEACIAETSIDLSWNAATGGATGYIVFVQSGTAIPEMDGDSAGYANTYTANNNYVTANTYATLGKAVYKGAGTTATITNLTSGDDYTFKVVAYNSETQTGWANGISNTNMASSYIQTYTIGVPLANITSASIAQNSSVIDWTNPLPTSCYEILIVANQGGATGFNPTGDGSAYVANPNYSGDPSYVFKGNGITTTVTGLTEGLEYCYTIFVRNRTTNEWSRGNTVCVTTGIDYCDSYGDSTDSYNTGVRMVQLGTFTNNSPDENNDYSDYTATPINILLGESYPLTVNVNTDGNWTVYSRAWIDWNHDGTFAANEQYELGSANNVNNGPTSASPLTINVPTDAYIGNVRMRVSAQYNTNPTACNTGFDGEVEDYTINITRPIGSEIHVEGNNNIIASGDSTTSGLNNTAFGASNVGTPDSNTFVIESIGTGTLNLTGTPDRVIIGGANASDFVVTSQPTNSNLATGSQDTFEITFTPSEAGPRTATVTIENDDVTDGENPFTFAISGTGNGREINVSGNTITIPNGSGIPELSTNNFTLFGNANINDSEVITKTFSIENTGNQSLSITNITLTGPDAADFIITSPTSLNIPANSNSPLQIDFSPTTIGVKDAVVTIANNDVTGSENPYTFSIRGFGVNYETCVSDQIQTIAIQDFEDSPATPTWSYTNTQTYASTVSIAGGTGYGAVGDSGNSPLYLDGKSFQLNNTVNTNWAYAYLEFSSIDTQSYDDVELSIRVGAFSKSSSLSGLDSDDVIVSISEDNGATWSDEVQVTGRTNSRWSFTSGTGVASVTYDNNNTIESPFTPSVGSQFQTTEGYSTINVVGLPSVSNLMVRITLKNNRSDEVWAIDNVTLTGKVPSVKTWDGTDWRDVSNNITTAPTSSQKAILDGNYNTTANGNIEACECEINTGAALTITNNHFVEIQNNITLFGTASILVHPQGAFVQINDDGLVTADNHDNIRVDKLTAPMDNWYEYTYWSSPVEGEIINEGLEDATTNRRFRFMAQNYRDSYRETNNNNDTSTSGQDNIDDPSTTGDNTGVDWQLALGSDIMLPGIGYASTHKESIFNSSPCASDADPNCQFNYSFNGLFNNGIVNPWMYRNDEELLDNNWNLIGNPYPSAISADAFLDYNADINGYPNRVVEGAIYLWSQNTAPSATANGNEQLNFSQSDYAIINGVGETATSAGGDGSDPTNRMIPSGQAFFIAMSDTAPTTEYVSNPTAQAGDIQRKRVVFNNSMRVRGTNDNSQFFRQNTTNTLNKLWLDLTTDNGVFNQILVGYVDNATNGLDKMYFDAPMASPNVNAVMYSIIEGSDKKYTIQGRAPESLTLNEVIPLGFSTLINTPTIYTLTISKLEGEFLTTNTIYVKDKLLNITHNLSETDYTFTSEAGEFNERFEIVFMPEALSIDDKDISPKDLTIIELNDNDVKFTIGANITIEHVEIIDLLGRTLYNFNGNSNSEIYNLSALSQATYLAKVTLSNGQVITKKAVKRK